MFTSAVLKHRLKKVRFLLLVVGTLIGVFYYSFLNESFELNTHLDEEELPHVTGSHDGLSKEQLDTMELSSWDQIVEKNKYYPMFNAVKPGTKVALRLPDDYFDNQKKITVRNWKKKEHYPVGKENYRKFPRVGATKEYPRVQTLEYTDGGKKDVEKLDEIRSVFKKSWKTYKDYGYGHDEVTPLSMKALDPFNGWAATLVDSLDTLAIMGLDDELKEGITFVTEKVNLKQSYRDVIPLFENTIRILGGLLAAYDITSDKSLLTSAKEVGELLMEAFDTPNRMPILFYDWMSEAQNRLPGKMSSLAEIGTLSLEFSRLTQLTGDNKYYDAIDRITDKFYKSRNDFIIKGLFANMLDVTGCRIVTKQEMDEGYHLKNKNVHKVIKDNSYVYCEFVDNIKSLHAQEDYSLAGLGDSFYEYLPKMFHLLRGHPIQAEAYKEMYLNAVSQIKNFMLFTPKIPGGEDVLFVSTLSAYDTKDFIELTPHHDMQHLACFTGGMMALGAKLFNQPEDMEYAEKVTKGCVHLYDIMGVMPEQIEVDRLDPGDKYDEAKRMKQLLGENIPGASEEPIEQQLLEGEIPDVKDMTKEEKERLTAKINEVLQQKKGSDSKKTQKEGKKLIPDIPQDAKLEEDPIPEAKDGAPIEKREIVEHVTVVEEGKPINLNIVQRGHFQPFVTDRDGTKRWQVQFSYNQPIWANDMYPSYILRPEAIESVFYMYRITGDAKWREYGWNMWKNVIKHCQKDGVFTSIKDITRPHDDPKKFDDSLESFWFAETLKYFYLLFEDATVLSLDEWVYNTEAHPFKLA